ncbi:MAG: 5-deoxy-glucuronate isomerase [Pyrinomonadaceae bacterium]|nr:5-deoxy-glucuronate isomerase [Acidobacteriota bacterium]MBK7932472.1 5-deoxy-glucuronate isomerase [Acidobacteriota bacterium]MBP7375592.1 5-deoxy-glucuronate isomerase [Pyrinomonadaceae bacterium]
MQTQIKLENIDPATCIVKATHMHKGRTRSVEPGTTASRNLFYGRIRLEAGDAPIAFENATHETGLICLNGSGHVTTGGQTFAMSRYDALYIPRDSKIIAASDGDFDLAELSSPVENQYPLQFVAFNDIRRDPALHFVAGKPPTERDLNVLIGKNVDAGRIMAGVTFSSDGNWTSFPPHEHQNMLEEAYLYIDMPAPQWGIQMVYTTLQEPEIVQVVHEGDVVIMPQGYHPNVAAPGGSINFLWMMAANREGDDRQFGVVNVQPEYASGGSGLEASQK